MFNIKYPISIIILLCLPIILQSGRLTETSGMDSVLNNETVNLDVSVSHADSTGEKIAAVPERHQAADSVNGNINDFEDGWFWFIGINLYPNELKIK